MQPLIFVMSLAAAALASPTLTTGPMVTILNGTVIGNSSNGIDSFRGIPFAKPPKGNLRLRRPEPFDKKFGVKKLPDVATACTNMDLSIPNTSGFPKEAAAVIESVAAPITEPQGEDCLSINVQRPSGVPRNAKLPVLFWIYGGGFQIGSAYDGAAIVEKSVEMGQPIIFVSANYRLNAFGFLGGKELQEEGNSNLGLHDQRKAMHWVAENIEAFGGDSDRVTIWGESAGAASVFDHLIAYGGDHSYNDKPLFHGAIMNSGTILRSLPMESKKAQDIFDNIAASVGCKNHSQVLSCLREAPYDGFVAAMNTQPNFMEPESNIGIYIPRPDPTSDLFPVSPEVAISEGRFARVPVIMGNQQDEATIFSIMQRDIINSTSTLVDYISSWLPETPRHIVANLIDTYPNDPAAGLPADTGDKWELFPQFKRLSAVQSDLTFTMAHREALSSMECEVPTWVYQASYLHNKLPYLGTYHTSDLGPQFGLEQDKFAANAMDTAYINFVHHLNPNGKSQREGDDWWPQWDSKHLRMVDFGASETTITRDDFRWESYEFWKKHSTQLRQ